MTHAELQSDFRASKSLSAEAEDFLDHLGSHPHAARTVTAHLSYLAKQGADLGQDLQHVNVKPADAAQLAALRLAVGQLTEALHQLSVNAGSEVKSKDSIAEIRAIRHRLSQEMPR